MFTRLSRVAVSHATRRNPSRLAQRRLSTSGPENSETSTIKSSQQLEQQQLSTNQILPNDISDISKVMHPAQKYLSNYSLILKQRLLAFKQQQQDKTTLSSATTSLGTVASIVGATAGIGLSRAVAAPLSSKGAAPGFGNNDDDDDDMDPDEAERILQEYTAQRAAYDLSPIGKIEKELRETKKERDEAVRPANVEELKRAMALREQGVPENEVMNVIEREKHRKLRKELAKKGKRVPLELRTPEEREKFNREEAERMIKALKRPLTPAEEASLYPGQTRDNSQRSIQALHRGVRRRFLKSLDASNAHAEEVLSGRQELNANLMNEIRDWIRQNPVAREIPEEYRDTFEYRYILLERERRKRDQQLERERLKEMRNELLNIYHSGIFEANDKAFFLKYRTWEDIILAPDNPFEVPELCTKEQFAKLLDKPYWTWTEEDAIVYQSARYYLDKWTSIVTNEPMLLNIIEEAQIDDKIKKHLEYEQQYIETIFDSQNVENTTAVSQNVFDVFLNTLKNVVSIDVEEEHMKTLEIYKMEDKSKAILDRELNKYNKIRADLNHITKLTSSFSNQNNTPQSVHKHYQKKRKLLLQRLDIQGKKLRNEMQRHKKLLKQQEHIHQIVTSTDGPNLEQSEALRTKEQYKQFQSQYEYERALQDITEAIEKTQEFHYNKWVEEQEKLQAHKEQLKKARKNRKRRGKMQTGPDGRPVRVDYGDADEEDVVFLDREKEEAHERYSPKRDLTKPIPHMFYPELEENGDDDDEQDNTNDDDDDEFLEQPINTAFGSIPNDRVTQELIKTGDIFDIKKHFNPRDPRAWLRVWIAQQQQYKDLTMDINRQQELSAIKTEQTAPNLQSVDQRIATIQHNDMVNKRLNTDVDNLENDDTPLGKALRHQKAKIQQLHKMGVYSRGSHDQRLPGSLPIEIPLDNHYFEGGADDDDGDPSVLSKVTHGIRNSAQQILPALLTNSTVNKKTNKQNALTKETTIPTTNITVQRVYNPETNRYHFFVKNKEELKAFDRWSQSLEKKRRRLEDLRSFQRAREYQAEKERIEKEINSYKSYEQEQLEQYKKEILETIQKNPQLKDDKRYMDAIQRDLDSLSLQIPPELQKLYQRFHQADTFAHMVQQKLTPEDIALQEQELYELEKLFEPRSKRKYIEYMKLIEKDQLFNDDDLEKRQEFYERIIDGNDDIFDEFDTDTNVNKMMQVYTPNEIKKLSKYISLFTQDLKDAENMATFYPGPYSNSNERWYNLGKVSDVLKVNDTLLKSQFQDILEVVNGDVELAKQLPRRGLGAVNLRKLDVHTYFPDVFSDSTLEELYQGTLFDRYPGLPDDGDENDQDQDPEQKALREKEDAEDDRKLEEYLQQQIDRKGHRRGEDGELYYDYDSEVDINLILKKKLIKRYGIIDFMRSIYNYTPYLINPPQPPTNHFVWPRFVEELIFFLTQDNHYEHMAIEWTPLKWLTGMGHLMGREQYEMYARTGPAHLDDPKPLPILPIPQKNNPIPRPLSTSTAMTMFGVVHFGPHTYGEPQDPVPLIDGHTNYLRNLITNYSFVPDVNPTTHYVDQKTGIIMERIKTAASNNNKKGNVTQHQPFVLMTKDKQLELEQRLKDKQHRLHVASTRPEFWEDRGIPWLLPEDHGVPYPDWNHINNNLDEQDEDDYDDENGNTTTTTTDQDTSDSDDSSSSSSSSDNNMMKMLQSKKLFSKQQHKKNNKSNQLDESGRPLFILDDDMDLETNPNRDPELTKDNVWSNAAKEIREKQKLLLSGQPVKVKSNKFGRGQHDSDDEDTLYDADDIFSRLTYHVKKELEMEEMLKEKERLEILLEELYDEAADPGWDAPSETVTLDNLLFRSGIEGALAESEREAATTTDDDDNTDNNGNGSNKNKKKKTRVPRIETEEDLEKLKNHFYARSVFGPTLLERLKLDQIDESLKRQQELALAQQQRQARGGKADPNAPGMMDPTHPTILPSADDNIINPFDDDEDDDEYGNTTTTTDDDDYYNNIPRNKTDGSFRFDINAERRSVEDRRGDYALTRGIGNRGPSSDKTPVDTTELLKHRPPQYEQEKYTVDPITGIPLHITPEMSPLRRGGTFQQVDFEKVDAHSLLPGLYNPNNPANHVHPAYKDGDDDNNNGTKAGGETDEELTEDELLILEDERLGFHHKQVPMIGKSGQNDNNIANAITTVGDVEATNQYTTLYNELQLLNQYEETLRKTMTDVQQQAKEHSFDDEYQESHDENYYKMKFEDIAKQREVLEKRLKDFTVRVQVAGIDEGAIMSVMNQYAQATVAADNKKAATCTTQFKFLTYSLLQPSDLYYVVTNMEYLNGPPPSVQHLIQRDAETQNEIEMLKQKLLTNNQQDGANNNIDGNGNNTLTNTDGFDLSMSDFKQFDDETYKILDAKAAAKQTKSQQQQQQQENDTPIIEVVGEQEVWYDADGKMHKRVLKRRRKNKNGKKDGEEDSMDNNNNNQNDDLSSSSNKNINNTSGNSELKGIYRLHQEKTAPATAQKQKQQQQQINMDNNNDNNNSDADIDESDFDYINTAMIDIDPRASHLGNRAGLGGNNHVNGLVSININSGINTSVTGINNQKSSIDKRKGLWLFQDTFNNDTEDFFNVSGNNEASASTPTTTTSSNNTNQQQKTTTSKSNAPSEFPQHHTHTNPTNTTTVDTVELVSKQLKDDFVLFDDIYASYLTSREMLLEEKLNTSSHYSTSSERKRQPTPNPIHQGTRALVLGQSINNTNVTQDVLDPNSSINNQQQQQQQQWVQVKTYLYAGHLGQPVAEMITTHRIIEPFHLLPQPIQERVNRLTLPSLRTLYQIKRLNQYNSLVLKPYYYKAIRPVLEKLNISLKKEKENLMLFQKKKNELNKTYKEYKDTIWPHNYNLENDGHLNKLQEWLLLLQQNVVKPMEVIFGDGKIFKNPLFIKDNENNENTSHPINARITPNNPLGLTPEQIQFKRDLIKEKERFLKKYQKYQLNLYKERQESRIINEFIKKGGKPGLNDMAGSDDSGNNTIFDAHQSLVAKAINQHFSPAVDITGDKEKLHKQWVKMLKETNNKEQDEKEKINNLPLFQKNKKLYELSLQKMKTKEDYQRQRREEELQLLKNIEKANNKTTGNDESSSSSITKDTSTIDMTFPMWNMSDQDVIDESDLVREYRQRELIFEQELSFLSPKDRKLPKYRYAHLTAEQRMVQDLKDSDDEYNYKLLTTCDKKDYYYNPQDANNNKNKSSLSSTWDSEKDGKQTALWCAHDTVEEEWALHEALMEQERLFLARKRVKEHYHLYMFNKYKEYLNIRFLYANKNELLLTRKNIEKQQKEEKQQQTSDFGIMMKTAELYDSINRVNTVANTTTNNNTNDNTNNFDLADDEDGFNDHLELIYFQKDTSLDGDDNNNNNQVNDKDDLSKIIHDDKFWENKNKQKQQYLNDLTYAETNRLMPEYSLAELVEKKDNFEKQLAYYLQHFDQDDGGIDPILFVRDKDGKRLVPSRRNTTLFTSEDKEYKIKKLKLNILNCKKLIHQRARQYKSLFPKGSTYDVDRAGILFIKYEPKDHDDYVDIDLQISMQKDHLLYQYKKYGNLSFLLKKLPPQDNTNNNNKNKYYYTEKEKQLQEKYQVYDVDEELIKMGYTPPEEIVEAMLAKAKQQQEEAEQKLKPTTTTTDKKKTDAINIEDEMKKYSNVQSQTVQEQPQQESSSGWFGWLFGGNSNNTTTTPNTTPDTIDIDDEVEQLQPPSLPTPAAQTTPTAVTTSPPTTNKKEKKKTKKQLEKERLLKEKYYTKRNELLQQRKEWELQELHRLVNEVPIQAYKERYYIFNDIEYIYDEYYNEYNYYNFILPNEHQQQQQNEQDNNNNNKKNTRNKKQQQAKKRIKEQNDDFRNFDASFAYTNIHLGNGIEQPIKVNKSREKMKQILNELNHKTDEIQFKPSDYTPLWEFDKDLWFIQEFERYDWLYTYRDKVQEVLDDEAELTRHGTRGSPLTGFLPVSTYGKNKSSNLDLIGTAGVGGDKLNQKYNKFVNQASNSTKTNGTKPVARNFKNRYGKTVVLGDDTFGGIDDDDDYIVTPPLVDIPEKQYVQPYTPLLLNNDKVEALLDLPPLKLTPYTLYNKAMQRQQPQSQQLQGQDLKLVLNTLLNNKKQLTKVNNKIKQLTNARVKYEKEHNIPPPEYVTDLTLDDEQDIQKWKFRGLSAQQIREKLIKKKYGRFVQETLAQFLSALHAQGQQEVFESLQQQQQNDNNHNGSENQFLYSNSVFSSSIMNDVPLAEFQALHYYLKQRYTQQHEELTKQQLYFGNQQPATDDNGNTLNTTSTNIPQNLLYTSNSINLLNGTGNILNQAINSGTQSTTALDTGYNNNLMMLRNELNQLGEKVKLAFTGTGRSSSQHNANESDSDDENQKQNKKSKKNKRNKNTNDDNQQDNDDYDYDAVQRSPNGLPKFAPLPKPVDNNDNNEEITHKNKNKFDNQQIDPRNNNKSQRQKHRSMAWDAQAALDAPKVLRPELQKMMLNGGFRHRNRAAAAAAAAARENAEVSPYDMWTKTTI